MGISLAERLRDEGREEVWPLVELVAKETAQKAIKEAGIEGELAKEAETIIEAKVKIDVKLRRIATKLLYQDVDSNVIAEITGLTLADLDEHKKSLEQIHIEIYGE